LRNPEAVVELVPGSHVQNYRVEAKLGAGASSSSYRVRHVVLDTLHALTVPSPGVPALHQRLVEGARIQARLRHQNLIAATDVVDVEGIPAVVLDYVDGPSLEAYVLAHPNIEVNAIDALAAGLFDGVSWLHLNGVAHRHLKPRNVIVDLGGKAATPRLTDFMFSRVIGVPPGKGPKVFGTPTYMAPEQTYDSKNADHRADLWALGCMLYHLCTSHTAFEGNSQELTFERVRAGEYNPVRRFVPSAPRRWVDAIAQCLVVDPAQRGPTAEAIAATWFAGTTERPRLSSRVAPVGTVALVFTDIQGSTKLWEQNADVARHSLRAHDAVMRAAIHRHGGYEVKTEGDSFMIAFGDPVQAARFCLTAQRGLYEQPWSEDLLAHPEASVAPGFQGLRVRMGIHVGQPEPRANGEMVDYFGPTVNRAARVSGAGHGGQIVVSKEAWVHIADSLPPEEVHWTPLGAYKLKGLDGSQEMLQLLPAEFAMRTFAPIKADKVG
jgi:class 3 adenylate cyclase